MTDENYPKPWNIAFNGTIAFCVAANGKTVDWKTVCIELNRSDGPKDGFWPIGYIANDGRINFEPGREPKYFQRGKLVYINVGRPDATPESK